MWNCLRKTMNRRSFIQTITASGVSLFLPKVIEPMKWKRTPIHTSDFVEGEAMFRGYSDIIVVDNDSWRLIDSADEPFSISAFYPLP